MASMKRFGLVIRLIFEAILGAVCLVDLFLLPEIWRHRDHISTALAELAGTIVFILIGLLCFKDVVKIVRILKGSLPSSYLN
jgi:hypothetical protein